MLRAWCRKRLAMCPHEGEHLEAFYTITENGERFSLELWRCRVCGSVRVEELAA